MKKYKVCVIVTENDLGTVVAVLAGEKRAISVAPAHENAKRAGETEQMKLILAWAEKQDAPWLASDPSLLALLKETGYAPSSASATVSRLLKANKLLTVRNVSPRTYALVR